MANTDDEMIIDHSEDGGQQKPKNPTVIVFAGVILLLAVVTYLILPGKAPQNTSASPGDNRYDPKQAEEMKKQDASSQQEAESLLEIGDVSVKGGYVALDLEVQSLKSDLQKARDARIASDKKTEDTLRQMQNKFDAQFKQLSGMLTNMSQGRVDSIQQSTADGGTSIEDYPVLPQAQESGKADDDGFNYKTFRTTRVEQGEPNEAASKTTTPSTSQSPNAAEVVAAVQKNMPTKPENDEAAEKEKKSSSLSMQTIPALSYVRVTNMHGVNCPMSGELAVATAAGSNLFTSVPVTIPIVGEFKGPNGESFSIGNAHLLGYCVGYELEGEFRARITVQLLSYVDAEGVSHTVDKVQGYVMDLSDNTQDLLGYPKKVRGLKMAKAAAAAGVSAIGKISTQSAFETNTSTSTGTVTSTLDSGEVSKAAAGAAFASTADLLTQQWLREANSVFDVVYVPSGRVFDFYSTGDIEVFAPKKHDEAFYAAYEPLL